MAGRAQGATIIAAPVGDVIDNGYDVGGGRNYLWSHGLAMSPPTMYSDYLGPASGVPQAPPVGSLPDTIGSSYGGEAPTAAELEVQAHPWGRTSPLPWVLAGLGVLLVVHYRDYDKGGK